MKCAKCKVYLVSIDEYDYDGKLNINVVNHIVFCPYCKIYTIEQEILD